MKNKFYQQILGLTKLSVKALDSFMEMGTPQTISKKTLITQPQKIVQDAYFLKEGIIRHYIIGQDQTEFTKNFISGPRFMLPSLSDFFMQTRSSIYCQALTDLEVIQWSYQDIISFADQHPSMYKFLLFGTVRAFRGKEQKEIALNQLDAKTRYQQFVKAQPKIINKVPLQQVASYLNIRPETLSRIRSELMQ